MMGTTSTSMDEPRMLIQQTTAAFNPKPDIEMTHRINEIITETEEIRSKQNDDARETLRALSRKLEIVKVGLEENELKNQKLQQPQKIVDLDSHKFSVARSINDLEKSVESLESQLFEIKEEMKRLDDETEKMNKLPADDKTLRLHIFQNIGIQMIQDEEGKYSKCTVRPLPRPEILHVDFDENHSRFFYSNLLWNMSLP